MPSFVLDLRQFGEAQKLRVQSLRKRTFGPNFFLPPVRFTNPRSSFFSLPLSDGLGNRHFGGVFFFFRTDVWTRASFGRVGHLALYNQIGDLWLLWDDDGLRGELLVTLGYS